MPVRKKPKDKQAANVNTTKSPQIDHDLTPDQTSADGKITSRSFEYVICARYRYGQSAPQTSPGKSEGICRAIQG